MAISVQEAIKQILIHYGTNVNAISQGDKALQRRLQRQINEDSMRGLR